MGAEAALGVLPALTSMATTALTNNANLNLTNVQNEYDYKKWREYLEYNDPANQIKRLRKAGANPMLAMSNGAIDSGNASSPPPQSHVPQMDFSPIAQGVRDSVDLYNQKRMQDSQIENLDAQTKNQELRNLTQLQRDLMELTKMYQSAAKDSKERELIGSQIEMLQKQISRYDEVTTSEVRLRDSQSKMHEAHADYLAAQKEYQDIINRFTPKQQEIITSNFEKQGRAIEAAASRDNSQAALNAAQKAVEECKKDGLDIDNDVAESIMQAKVDMAFSQSDESYWKSQNESKDYHRGKYASGFTPGGSLDFPDWSSGKVTGGISYPTRKSHDVIRRRSNRRSKYFRPE